MSAEITVTPFSAMYSADTAESGHSEGQQVFICRDDLDLWSGSSHVVLKCQPLRDVSTHQI